MAAIFIQFCLCSEETIRENGEVKVIVISAGMKNQEPILYRG